MPIITYNGQSLAIDSRRLWLLGASIQYAKIPPALWAARIAAAKQAGFNTIQTSCPWTIHEPRTGRFVFDGEADVRTFIQTCAEAGMRAVVRVGPYVGDEYDGGGLPGWLIDTPGIRVRESNPVFLEHVSRYFRRLIGEIADLQVTSGGGTGGPILLVQSEHAWTCTNEAQANTYLHDVTRYIRESGIDVPVINANDLWQETRGTIDTWRGYDDLLAHLRQLQTVQPDAPRIVSAFKAADVATWGDGQSSRSASPKSKIQNSKSADAALRRLAEILAAGAQPIVSPFHAGTNYDFLGGRIAGRAAGFVTTSGAHDPPLGEAGTRGEKYHAIRRLITFANHFAPVFAELEPEYQPIVMDPETGAGTACNGASVVAQRGPQGRIVFVFAHDDRGSGRKAGDRTASLVLDEGVRLPVHLGRYSTAWFALDVDLHGLGRLDYSNISPWGIVDRSVVVFYGPAGAAAYLSISGTPLEAAVPGHGRRSPTIVQHHGLTIVICNEDQIDATYHNEKALYIGINGFDEAGAPRRDPNWPEGWIIRHDAKMNRLEDAAVTSKRRGAAARPASSRTIAFFGWQASPSRAHVQGVSPRFASLEGPQSLSECGAPAGYGWYRVRLKRSGRALCHLPNASDRLHLFINGKLQRVFGIGPGADPRPFWLPPAKGEQSLVALVDNFGRFSEGNDLGRSTGLWGHIYAVKPLRTRRPKITEQEPVDPFVLRGFLIGRVVGQLSDSRQAVWTFFHTRKTPLLIDVNGARTAGTWTLNDRPVSYYAGSTGGNLDRVVIDPAANKTLKRGKNVLRFAPDAGQEKAAEDIVKTTTLYECVNALSEGGSSDSAGNSGHSGAWAFAKWEPPPISSYDEMDGKRTGEMKGLPCWWRTTFTIEQDEAARSRPLWLDVASLSKGQAYINGRNLGRFFSATASGKRVGPQTRLYVPEPWIKPGVNNELVIFDEHGFAPSRVRLIRSEV